MQIQEKRNILCCGITAEKMKKEKENGSRKQSEPVRGNERIS